MRKTLACLLLMLPSLLAQEEIVKIPEKIKTVKADFRTSYAHLRKWEANYSNNPYDMGGETYGGITRTNNPKWYGWRYIDSIKPQHIEHNTLIPKAEFWVLDYYVDIWVRDELYEIYDQDVATATLDMEMHGPWGIVLLQRALAKCNQTTGNLILDLNRADKHLFLVQLREERIKFYRGVVSRYPEQKVFLQGWINRAYDI